MTVRIADAITFTTEWRRKAFSVTKTVNIKLDEPVVEQYTSMEKREVEKSTRLQPVTYEWHVALLKVQWYWSENRKQWAWQVQIYGQILNPRTRQPYESGWRAGDVSMRYLSGESTPDWVTKIVEKTRPMTKIVYDEKQLSKREVRELDR